MDQQIINPDLGKNYKMPISNGDLHFKMEEKIYIEAVQIVARLRIVMLHVDATALSVLIKYESRITQTCFDSPQGSAKVGRFPK